MRPSAVKPTPRCVASASVGTVLVASFCFLASTLLANAQPSPPEAHGENDATMQAAPSQPNRDENAEVGADGSPARDADEPRSTNPEEMTIPAGASEDAGTQTAEEPPPNESQPVEETVRQPDTDANSGTPNSDTAISLPELESKSSEDEPKEGERSEAKSSDAPAAKIEEAATSTDATLDQGKLTVTTWAGAYGQAQRDVVIEGFKEKQAIEVDVIERRGDGPIDLAARSGDGLPDAAELTGDEIDAGCNSGDLVKLAGISPGDVSSTSTASDFIAGSLKSCGIGAFAWSHVFAVNSDSFSEDRPVTISDVFDTKRFPGKRAFMKEPRFLLEAALMADGVEPKDVYPLIREGEGLERAFTKLDSIRDDILWVENAESAMSAVSKGEAVIGQTFSGRAFFSAARGAPIDILWDGQIYAMTYWAIPAKSPRQDLARKFLDFATGSEQLAGVAQKFPYGPTRKSAVELAKLHTTAGLALDNYLPTEPGNMKNALASDEVWWAGKGKGMKVVFDTWLTQPPKPAQGETDSE